MKPKRLIWWILAAISVIGITLIPEAGGTAPGGTPGKPTSTIVADDPDGKGKGKGNGKGKGKSTTTTTLIKLPCKKNCSSE